MADFYASENLNDFLRLDDLDHILETRHMWVLAATAIAGTIGETAPNAQTGFENDTRATDGRTDNVLDGPLLEPSKVS